MVIRFNVSTSKFFSKINYFISTFDFTFNNISTGKNITQHALILIRMHRFNGNDIVIGTCSRLIEVLLIFLSEFHSCKFKILNGYSKIVCLVVLQYDRSWQPIGCMCEPYNYFLNAIF